MSAQPSWRKFVCLPCGHIYDERLGDPQSGLAPGTRFEDIAPDWTCPVCGVSKADFVLLEESENVGRSLDRPDISSSRPLRDYDIVIVGAGVAAWELVEAIRRRCSARTIAMVSACDADRYDKPLLSVAHARGLSSSDLVKERGTQAASRLGVEIFVQTVAFAVNQARRELRTTRGNIQYKNLVFAHGASSFLPQGLPASLCWRINHLSQYQRLSQHLADQPQHVLIAGAGLIGCELANDLALGGHTVTLVEQMSHPLPGLVKDVAVASRLLEAWQSLPIHFIGNRRVVQVKSLGSQREVTLDTGSALQVDHVVVAMGLHTPDRLARSADLRWDKGIAVDEATLQTSVAGIYAMGDCISVNGQTSRFIEPIRRQATTVAGQITGLNPVLYRHMSVPVRVKTTSYPVTIQPEMSEVRGSRAA